MSARHDAVLALAVGFIALGSAHAQGAPSSGRVGFAAGLGATYGNLVGGDFGGSKPAAGFDANAAVVLHRWELGVGYDRANHGHEDTDGNYVVSNAYLEPRLRFPSARRWTPYVATRVGLSMASYQGVLGLTDTAKGYLAGIGAGLLWPIAGHVQADAGAHYARLAHDYGTGGFADAEKGGQASLRVGVRYASRR